MREKTEKDNKRKLRERTRGGRKWRGIGGGETAVNRERKGRRGNLE